MPKKPKSVEEHFEIIENLLIGIILKRKPNIKDVAKIVGSLLGPRRQHALGWYTFRQLARVGGQVEQHPVDPGASGRVRVIAN